jgi:Metal binding domain of Ada
VVGIIFPVGIGHCRFHLRPHNSDIQFPVILGKKANMKSIGSTSVLLLLVIGCHQAQVTRFDSSYYPPTQTVQVFSDPSLVPHDYIEIGYVEAKGGLTVSKQALLDDMKEKAMAQGADALLKVEFYDRERYDPNIGGYSKPAAKALMIKYKQLTEVRSDSVKYVGSVADSLYHRLDCPSLAEKLRGSLQYFRSQAQAQAVGFRPCPGCILKSLPGY